MAGTPSPCAALPAPSGGWNHPAWSLLLLALAGWQGWMTLALFGTDRPWTRLLNNQPVVSGRHALHLYHGFLGAQAFYQSATLCCYDPSFQAGYPKTPIFDSGSRPAELFLLLAGGVYRPAAYKLGLAICCVVVPFLLCMAARATGFSWGCVCLVVVLGLCVWWGKPSQEALEAGDLNLIVAAMALLAQMGLLIRFDQNPGLITWLGILVCGHVGWFAYPVLCLLLLPLALVYYVSVGTRHQLIWHLALLGSLAGAVASNAFWLLDWVHYWWLRAPSDLKAPVLSHRTLHTIWDAPLWGDQTDRALAMALLALAVLGVWRLNAKRQRAAARLFGLGALGFLLLAVGAICWQPLGQTGAARLLVPALLFAVLPAVHALRESARLLSGLLGASWRAGVVAGGAFAALGVIGHEQLEAFATHLRAVAPLEIGLDGDRQDLLDTLREHTTPEARILWEDRRDWASPRWTALLPVLTGRSFLGGLDPEGEIEHTCAGLVDLSLAGQPLPSWSDEELESYCRRYNIGWVVCWSPAAVERFRAWKGTVPLAPVHDHGDGYVFQVPRDKHSYALVGDAQWLHADAQRITLGDVLPENGEVVLSLHYQEGMQVSPGRVEIERYLDPQDPIPLVRLKVAGPVARVTLTWRNP
jgi:hypothetical protein